VRRNREDWVALAEHAALTTSMMKEELEAGEAISSVACEKAATQLTRLAALPLLPLHSSNGFLAFAVSYMRLRTPFPTTGAGQLRHCMPPGIKRRSMAFD
jgi:hypothetical protein